MMNNDTMPLVDGFILKGHHDYKILKTLNKGGFGITYLAEAEYMDHNIPQTGTYAIKEFFPDGLCHRNADGSVSAADGKKASFRESYDEFRAEAECLHSLSHPGIVPVNEVIESSGTVYYVMRYLKGKSLEDYVADNGGALSEDEAKRIAAAVGRALTYLHGNRILHLDVKPDNIMITGGNPVLIDFGSSRRFRPDGSPLNKKMSVCVTDGYSPEEQYMGFERFAPTADVYALAATTLFMLKGRQPVKATEISKKWVYSAMPDMVSETVADAIADALSRSADDRTPSVSKFIDALKGGKDNQGRNRPATVKIETSRPSGHYKIISALVAVIAVCVLAFLLFRNASSTPAPSTGKGTAAVEEMTTNTGINEKEDVKKEEIKEETKEQIATHNTDNSVSNVTTGGTQQTVAVQSPEPVASTPPTHSQQPAVQEVTSGTLNLGYATWTGGIKNGKPDGKGTMAFSSNHVIDSRDIDGNVASAGDRVEGKYSNGHLVFGTWHKSTGETQKILIGQ